MPPQQTLGDSHARTMHRARLTARSNRPPWAIRPPTPRHQPDDQKGAISTPMATSAEDRLKKIIAEQLSVNEDEVTPEANFIDDLNADSLDLVELIMSLEEEFNVKISDEEAEKIRTV